MMVRKPVRELIDSLTAEVERFGGRTSVTAYMRSGVVTLSHLLLTEATMTEIPEPVRDRDHAREPELM